MLNGSEKEYKIPFGITLVLCCFGLGSLIGAGNKVYRTKCNRDIRLRDIDQPQGRVVATWYGTQSPVQLGSADLAGQGINAPAQIESQPTVH